MSFSQVTAMRLMVDITFLALSLPCAHLIAAKDSCSSSGARQFRQWWKDKDTNYEQTLQDCDTINQEFDENASLELFRITSSCSEENTEKFIYEGQGDLLEGVGVLRKWSEKSQGNKIVCVIARKIYHKYLVRLAASFSGGRSSGYVRADYSDGLVLHCLTKQSHIHGPKIIEDSSGKIFFDREFNGRSKGGKWFRIPGNDRVAYLAEGSRKSFLYRGDNDVFRGRLLDKSGVMTDISALDPVSFEIPAKCPLDMKGNSELKESDLLYSLKEDVLVNTTDTLLKCNGIFEGEFTPMERIARALNETFFSLDRDLLWSVSPYRESISSPVKIFDDLKRVQDDNYVITIDGVTYGAVVKSPDMDKVPRGYVQIALTNRTEEQDKFWTPISFEGYFEGSSYNGPLLMLTLDGRYVNTRVKAGVMHSVSVVLGLRPLYTSVSKWPQENGIGVPGIGLLTAYRNGCPEGYFWVGLIGGGYLHGKLDAEGKITGRAIAYIYPDGETALKGEFVDGKMVAAREVRVLDLSCGADGIPVASFGQPLSEEIFRYDPPTNTSFGESPLLRDPLDRRNVQVLPSQVAAGSGDGLFARRPIRQKQTVTLFSARRFTAMEYQLHQQQCHWNMSLSAETRRLCTKFQIGLETMEGGMLSIPPEVDGAEFYSATSGHKANCGFGDQINAVYTEFEHPRFGLIIRLVATRDIDAGEEILLDYGYKEGDFPGDHLWYHEAKKHYEESLELSKNIV